MKNTMSAAKRCRRCDFLIEEPAVSMHYEVPVPLCQCPRFTKPLRAGAGIELMRPNIAAIRSNQENVRLFYAEQPHVEPTICAATGKPCDPRCDNRCRLSLRDQAIVDSIMGNGPPATDTSTTRTHTDERAAAPDRQLIYLCFNCGKFTNPGTGWPACACERPDTPGGHYAWICLRCGRDHDPETPICSCRAASASPLTESTEGSCGIWCGDCSGDERCTGCGKADEPSAAPPTESACESCWPESCAATAPIVRYDTIDRTASGDGISCRHCKGYRQAPAKWADHLGEPVLCVCARCRSCGERAHPGGRCRTSLFSRGFARIENI